MRGRRLRDNRNSRGSIEVTCALRSVLAVSAVLIGACANDPGGAPDSPAALVAGEYEANGELGAYRLIAVGSDGAEIDWLARGASVVLRLDAEGGTTGRLFVPDADEDGGDLESDLTGTFAVADGIVTFDHEADTFMRDMPFAWENGMLRGDRTFGETRVVLELVRR